MKLPLKLEYACRVLIQLKPTFVSGEVRRVEELAKREKISPNYLTQILNELRMAGLVESRRGKNGGYILARDPEEVSLADIVRASEGAFLELNGSSDGESAKLTEKMWGEVFASVEEQLEKRKLSDMGTEETVEMWHI